MNKIHIFFNKAQNLCKNYVDVLILLGITMLTYWVKFYSVQNFSIYGDEAFSIFHAQKPLGSLLEILRTDRNPPFFFVLLHFWIKMVGISSSYVKILPSIFSAATVLLLYFFGKRHFNRLAGIFASISFLFSDVHFDQGHEIRAFSLVIFLVVLSSYLFFELLEKKSWKYVFYLFFVNILMLFTHYISFFFIVAQFFSFLIFYIQNKSIGKYFMAMFSLVFLFYFPYMGVVVQNIPKDQEFWLSKATFQDLTYVFEKLAEDQDLESFFWGITIASVFLIIIRRKWNLIPHLDWRKHVYLLFWSFIPVISCYLVAQITPIFRLKYVLFSSPGWMFVVGYFISSLPFPSFLRVICVLPFFVWNIKHFYPEDRGIERWDETARIVKEMKKERTLTVITAGYKHIDFAYYYNEQFFKQYDQTVELLKKDNVIEAYNSFHVESVDLSKYDRVILVQSHHLVVDPKNAIEKYLNDHFVLCKRYGDSQSALVSLYTMKDQPCNNLTLQRTMPADSSLCQWFNKEVWTDQMGSLKVEKYISTLELNRNHCPRKTQITSDKFYSGKYSNRITQSIEFGLTLVEEIENVSEVSANFKLYPQDQLCDALFVVTLENESTTIFRSETKLKELAPNINAWNNVQILLSVPEEKRTKAKLKAYIWNPRSCVLYADDYVISITTNNK